MTYRPYRHLATTTIRATIAVLSRLGWFFSGRVAEMSNELLLRELDVIAETEGAYLVTWIVGEQ